MKNSLQQKKRQGTKLHSNFFFKWIGFTEASISVIQQVVWFKNLFWVRHYLCVYSADIPLIWGEAVKCTSSFLLSFEWNSFSPSIARGVTMVMLYFPLFKEWFFSSNGFECVISMQINDSSLQNIEFLLRQVFDFQLAKWIYSEEINSNFVE